MTSAILDVTLDRPMPQSPDAERSVLGAIIINNNAFDRVNGILSKGDFFKDSHRAIYEAMRQMAELRHEIDPLTLKEFLIKHAQLDQAGGVAYISALMDVVPDVANVERYAHIVKAKAELRRLIVIGNSTMRRALDKDADADEIAADATERLQAIRPPDAKNSVMSLHVIADRLERLYHDGGVARGASTGWPTIDNHYTVAEGAWTLITGVPGHGKSGFLDQLTLNLARKHDWQVVMFSAENFPPESHVASLIEKHVRMPFNEGPTARMRPADVVRGLQFIESRFRFINPATEGMSLDRLLSICTALAEEREIKVLTIDPWNELHHDRDPHVSETEYISASLTKVRRWARKHRAHVYLVAHPQKMHKDRDTGKYGVPTPYDVSGSAHWRNKADYCICVYRDITNGDEDPNVEIHIQKVRRREMGKLGMVTLRYDKVTSEYSDPLAPRRAPEFFREDE